MSYNPITRISSPFVHHAEEGRLNWEISQNISEVKVYSTEKSEHSIYTSLREAGRDIQHSISIIGLDSEEGAVHTVRALASMYGISVDEFLKTPFFLYLEEYITLGDATPLFNHPNFLGVISHIKDTCVQVFTRLGIKCYHLPTSSGDKDSSKIIERIASLHSNRPVNFVFWGSYKDYTNANRFDRGVSLVDSLILNLLNNGVDIRLLIKNSSKTGLLHCQQQYPEKVGVVTDYLDEDKLHDLFYAGDIYLLPSKQVHSASLTDAFSYGMPVIGSTGWGMSEYCFNGLNSLIGDRSKSLPNIAEYVNSMTPRLTALCGDRGLLARMSENTLAWYNSNHSRENHKANLHRLVDLAMSRHVK